MAIEILNDEYMPAMTEMNAIFMSLDAQEDAYTEAQMAEAELANRTGIFAIAGIFLASALIAIFLIMALKKRITEPLTQIKSAMTDLVAGNLSADVSYDSKDEFGDTCNSFRVMMKEFHSVIGEITRAMKCFQNGDFNVTSTVDFPGEFDEIKKAISFFIVKMNSTLKNIAGSAEQVNSASDQVSSSAQALAQGASEQASAVEELAATINDNSGKIADNATNAKNAS